MKSKNRTLHLAFGCAAGLLLLDAGYSQNFRFEKDLLATAPVFVEARAAVPAAQAQAKGSPGSTAPGAPLVYGVSALRARGEGAARRYYTLLAARDAACVMVYSAEGTRLAQIPAKPYVAAMAPPIRPGTATSATPAAAGGAPPTTPGARPALLMPPATAKDAELDFASDFDVDADGRVIIADRGAGAVKIYDSTGALLSLIPVQQPVSVAALPEGEIAVTNWRAEKLVQVYALRPNPVGGASNWKIVREFGEPADITNDEASKDLNRYVNAGRLSADRAGNIYYTFNYLPEPTVRKYDRWGFLITEFSLTTPEFQPSAQSARRAIERLRQQRSNLGGSTGPILHTSVTALGVDPATQDLWVAMGTLLLHFDKDGSSRGAYRTYTPDSLRVEASAILVEADRLLISSDLVGSFAFPRPDKQKPSR